MAEPSFKKIDQLKVGHRSAIGLAIGWAMAYNMPFPTFCAHPLCDARAVLYKISEKKKFN